MHVSKSFLLAILAVAPLASVAQAPAKIKGGPCRRACLGSNASHGVEQLELLRRESH